MLGRLCSWRFRDKYELEDSMLFCFVNRKVFVMLWEAWLFLPSSFVWRRRISFSYVFSPPFPSCSLSVWLMLSMNISILVLYISVSSVVLVMAWNAKLFGWVCGWD